MRPFLARLAFCYRISWQRSHRWRILRNLSKDVIEGAAMLLAAVVCIVASPSFCCGTLRLLQYGRRCSVGVVWKWSWSSQLKKGRKL